MLSTFLFHYCFAIVAFLLSQVASHGLNNCKDIDIPVHVTVPRYRLNVTVKDNWDAVALTFNLTRRDTNTPGNPLPIEDGMTKPIKSTFKIAATFCGTGNTTLVLTHGILESKKYWHPSCPDAREYSLIDAAVKAGYSVLSYDRIGVGASSTIDASRDAQFQVQAAVLNELVAYVRTHTNTNKVGLVGHSYGSYITALSASQIDVDVIILTGFSGSFANFAPFVAGAGFRVANLQNPVRWGHLDSGYLTSSDLFSEAFVYFKEPYFSHSVAAWSHDVASEPFAIGELPSVLKTEIDYSNITAPVFLLQGQYDVSACGGNCVGLLNTSAALFSGSREVQYVDDLPAGHNLNLHNTAPEAFRMIFDFLKKQTV